MVAPVTGPFSRNMYDNTSLPMVHYYREWYRQKKPRQLRLWYRMELGRWITGPLGYADFIPSCPWPTYCSDDCYAKAYAKFVDKVGEKAQLAASFAEGRQSVDMIVKRSKQITAVMKALRRGNVYSAMDALGMTRASRPKGVKSSGKAAANNFLELHLGWEPLVKDIGQAVNVLQGGIPPVTVRATNREVYTQLQYKTPTSTCWVDFDHKVQLIADVRVSNPNLWLANQLGFINPAQVAWELVPFSFVVDWFVNVGQFLSSFTDFAGVELSNSARTDYGTNLMHLVDTNYGVNLGARTAMYRRPGEIAPPKLHMASFKGLSVWRGATAVSLLVQQLKH